MNCYLIKTYGMTLLFYNNNKNYRIFVINKLLYNILLKQKAT